MRKIRKLIKKVVNQSSKEDEDYDEFEAEFEFDPEDGDRFLFFLLSEADAAAAGFFLRSFLSLRSLTGEAEELRRACLGRLRSSL